MPVGHSDLDPWPQKWISSFWFKWTFRPNLPNLFKLYVKFLQEQAGPTAWKHNEKDIKVQPESQPVNVCFGVNNTFHRHCHILSNQWMTGFRTDMSLGEQTQRTCQMQETSLLFFKTCHCFFLIFFQTLFLIIFFSLLINMYSAVQISQSGM